MAPGLVTTTATGIVAVMGFCGAPMLWTSNKKVAEQPLGFQHVSTGLLRPGKRRAVTVLPAPAKQILEHEYTRESTLLEDELDAIEHPLSAISSTPLLVHKLCSTHELSDVSSPQHAQNTQSLSSGAQLQAGKDSFSGRVKNADMQLPSLCDLLWSALNSWSLERLVRIFFFSVGIALLASRASRKLFTCCWRSGETGTETAESCVQDPDGRSKIVMDVGKKCLNPENGQTDYCFDLPTPARNQKATVSLACPVLSQPSVLQTDQEEERVVPRKVRGRGVVRYGSREFVPGICASEQSLNAAAAEFAPGSVQYVQFQ